MNSRGQHNGYGVVHDALAKKQRIQIPVSVQLVKDGQHRHCGDTKKTLKTLLAFTLMHAVLLPVLVVMPGSVAEMMAPKKRQSV